MKKYGNFFWKIAQQTRLREYDKKKNMNYELRAELKTPFKNAKVKRGKNNKAKREEKKWKKKMGRDFFCGKS